MSYIITRICCVKKTKNFESVFTNSFFFGIFATDYR